MSFLFHKTNQAKCIKMQGKENDSFLAHHFIHISHSLKERTSAFTSKGSITLEASLAVSFFFFGALCLVCLFEVLLVQTTVKSALHAVGKELAVEAYVSPMISATKMEHEIVEIIGQERLEKSLIAGGSNGFDCSNSKKYWNTTIMDLSVRYEIEVPIFIFRIPLISKEEKVRIKGWTGHEVKQTENIENKMVYITDYGIVYHEDMYCTYLELSIKEVEKDDVMQLRNQSGGVYKACQSCKDAFNANQKVYITDFGERYHFSLECTGLKRNIYAISLTDVKGLGGCSKCVK